MMGATGDGRGVVDMTWALSISALCEYCSTCSIAVNVFYGTSSFVENAHAHAVAVMPLMHVSLSG